MPDLDRFLREDLGREGDLTTDALLGRGRRSARARLWTREPIIVAGTRPAAALFDRLGVRTRIRARDGARAPAGATLLEAHGPAKRILSGERVALNLLGRMSGIATLTRAFVDAARAKNPRCEISATRKTTPGFREYEKAAVVIGGGTPHRMGLFDGILIKDNHLALVPSIQAAVGRAKAAHPRRPVEVEVSTARQAEAAAKAGADWLLIDNLAPAAARAAARRARALRPEIRIEVSGGLTLRRVPAYAAFADRLSVGGLTHSARSSNVTLDWLSPKH